jgi:ribulose-phosphate 3-epimerase
MNHLVAPSLLAANFGHLQHDIDMINQSQADWLHLDVMDGVFVPNISFGMPVVRAIRKLTSKPLDTHLMIIEPQRYISRFHDLGVNRLTVHLETCKDLPAAIRQIKDAGMKAGVSISPDTPVSELQPVLTTADLFLIMSVHPGFGAQGFIESSYDKIRALRRMLNESGSGALIEVDGGVTLENAGALVDAGVDVLVAGNTVFSSPDPMETIRLLKSV